MLSKGGSRVKIDEISGTEKFLNDLESINKALFADKSLHRLPISADCCGSMAVESHLSAPKNKPNKSKYINKKLFGKEKKPSFWSWRGLKAWTHSRNRRFNCCFSLLVHSIEGLPSFFDDVRLIVHWKRRDGEQMTSSARVHKGVAKFEEKLTHSSSVNFSGSSSSHNLVKYESKHFLLYASVYNAPELDFGKHRIDLTRLLPLTLEELEEEKSSGKWTTNFRLSGKARGATMNVSFGYVVVGNNRETSSKNNARDMKSESFVNRTDLMNELSMRRLGNLPARLDLKPELCKSVNVLYRKLDEEISNDLVENKLHNGPFPSYVNSSKLNSFKHPGSDEKNLEKIQGICEFSVSENAIEDLTKEHVKPKEDPCRHKQEIDICNSTEKVSSMLSKELLMQELEMALSQASDLMNEELDSQEGESEVPFQDRPLNSNALLGDLGKGTSPELDDITDAVADDFLKMLGEEHGSFDLSSESEPDSPRELLLKQFEKDVLANGGILKFHIENDPTGSVWEDMSNDFYQSSILEGFREMSRIEDLESEALMHERELNEKEFQHSLFSESDGKPEDLDQLPSLAEGSDSFLRTRNGWFLSSMNPSLFMEGINGNTIHEIALEGAHVLERADRQGLLSQIGSKIMQNMSSVPGLGKCGSRLLITNTDYVSLEDIPPSTMDKIEALSIEGLRIQYGMHEGKRLDIKDKCDNVDGLMGLTLDEWMKLYSGEIDDDDLISERSSRILEAHRATSSNLIRRGRGRKYGLSGDSFITQIQVPKVYITFPLARNTCTSEEEKDPKATEKPIEDKDEEEVIPEYETKEVRVSGLKMEAGKGKLWGSNNQQQFGSRWVVANGMGKKKKHEMKWKASSSPWTTRVKYGDTLWSISS